MRPSNRDIWFWEKMTEIYGLLWVKNFGKQPLRVWAKALAKFDDKQIKTGLAKCLVRKDATGRIDKYPPNLAEFVQLCKTEPTPACHKIYKALPKPKPNKERVKGIIAEVRQILARA